MRKVILLLLFQLSSLFLLAQPSYEMQNFIDSAKQEFKRIYFVKTNPLNFIYSDDLPLTSEFRLNVELGLSDRFAVEFGGSYYTKSLLLYAVTDSTSNSTNSYDWLKIGGYRFQGQFRVYMPEIIRRLSSPYVHSGTYMALHVSYSYAKYAERQSYSFNQYTAVTHYNVNFLYGMQFAFSKRLVGDTFVGIGYKKNTWNYRDYQGKVQNIDTEDLGVFYNSNFNLMIGFNLGLAW